MVKKSKKFGSTDVAIETVFDKNRDSVHYPEGASAYEIIEWIMRA